jgi:hypothetical protein
MLRRLPVTLWLAGLFLLAGAGAALAYWTVTVAYAPTNYALGGAGTLSAPANPTATVNGSGSVTVGWSLPGAQLSGAQYRVTRTSPSPQTVCTVSSVTTSCTDTGLTPGTAYSYSVAAVLSSWSSSMIATSATTSTPTFAITLSSGPYTAGTPISVTTIQAKLGAATDTTYTGSKTLNWTGLANSPSGQTPTYPVSAVTFTNGSASPGSTFTAFSAGSNTLTATDAAASGVTGGTTFAVSTAGASKLTLTTQPSNGTSGTALTTQPVVAVQDAYGNTVTSDTSNVSIALTTPAGATLTCTANPKAAVAGIATFAGCKVDKTGIYTLTATDGSLTSAVSTSFTISAGTASKLAFSTQPGNGTGGTALATQPSVTVQDTGGNTVTSDTSNVSIALTTPAGATLTCTANPKAAVSGIATFAGCKVDKTGTYTVTATDAGLISAVSSSFTISAGAATSLNLSPASTTPTAGATDNLTITAIDAGGNTATGYTGSKSLSFSGASTIGANNPTVSNSAGTAVNFGAGTTISFTSGVSTTSGATNGVMKLVKAETFNLAVTDGAISQTSVIGITVSAGTAASLTLSPASTTPTAGAADNLTITAKDAFGNTAIGYTGSKTLTFSGASTIGTNNPTVSNSAGTAVNFGASTTISFASGVSTTSGATNGVMTLVTAETFNLAVTDGAIGQTSTIGITVSPGTANTFALANCTLSGSTTACTGSFILGNSPGNVKANVDLEDSFGNIAPVTSSVTITVSSSSSTNFAVTGSPVTVAGTPTTPASRSTSQFTVTHQNNSSGSATITLSATGFTNLTFAVQK